MQALDQSCQHENSAQTNCASPLRDERRHETGPMGLQTLHDLHYIMTILRRATAAACVKLFSRVVSILTALNCVLSYEVRSQTSMQSKRRWKTDIVGRIHRAGTTIGRQVVSSRALQPGWKDMRSEELKEPQSRREGSDVQLRIPDCPEFALARRDDTAPTLS